MRCRAIGFHAGKRDGNSRFLVNRSSAVRSAASKPLQAMTAQNLDARQGLFCALSDPRISRATPVAKPVAALAAGLARPGLGLGLGHMMRTAASRCTRSARSWLRAASRAMISPANSARLRDRAAMAISGMFRCRWKSGSALGGRGGEMGRCGLQNRHERFDPPISNPGTEAQAPTAPP